MAFVPERSIDGREDITTVDLRHRPATPRSASRRRPAGHTQALRRTLVGELDGRSQA